MKKSDTMTIMQEKKTILVTGGAGFIGSHLCERLVKDGHTVISLDNYFTGSKDNHVEGVEYREGHTKNIEKHISERPDIIFHLGEYSRVEQSLLEPDLVEDLNIEGTKGVIAFWEKHGCKLVYAGSSTKFGDQGATRNTSPYARTKADNSELVYMTGESEHLPYAITYFYNVYGPRERSGVYGTVIEHFKRMYLSGTPCAIVSPGTQQRNFTHVLDIVDALIRIAKTEENGEYGLGNKRAYSIFEVADFFGFSSNRVMFPPREGNRMSATLDTKATEALGWSAERELEEYIRHFVAQHTKGQPREKRVLLFSTTIHPVAGRAEDAFLALAEALPDVHFDVVTTKFTRKRNAESLRNNIQLYCVGTGTILDKFLLPILGYRKAKTLAARHTYLFAWSLMASYAALAGILFRRMSGTPLLITLADQNIADFSFVRRWFFRLVLSSSDQVYGTHSQQEKQVIEKAAQMLPRNTLGEGDAFANALRFAYADIIRKSV